MGAYDMCCLINIFSVWVAIVISKMNLTQFEFELFDNTIGRYVCQSSLFEIFL